MLMLKNVACSDAPWSIYDEAQGVVVDAHGRLVAIVPREVPKISASGDLTVSGHAIPVPRQDNLDPRFHLANRELVRSAPELLAALKEAAYHLDRAGTPLTERYYELINRASGGTNVQPFTASSKPCNDAYIDSET